MGIGTAVPGEKLHVVGNTKQNNVLTVTDSKLSPDEDIITLSDFGNNEACHGTVFVWHTTYNGIARFHRDNFNTIVLDSATAGLFNNDGSDGYMNIYNVSNNLTIHNRLGTSVYVEWRVER